MGEKGREGVSDHIRSVVGSQMEQLRKSPRHIDLLLCLVLPGFQAFLAQVVLRFRLAKGFKHSKEKRRAWKLGWGGREGAKPRGVGVGVA